MTESIELKVFAVVHIFFVSVSAIPQMKTNINVVSKSLLRRKTFDFS